ncbi:MAG TPA: RecX family transcriptional regulator [Ruminococcaceae bacterium]|nr:RecX family transcriptional regulator [Oscillospiraceae bacterium]
MEITEIRRLKNGRYGLFSADDFLLSLSGGALLDSGLAKGDRLEEEQLAHLRAVVQKEKAKEKAYRLLTGRDHAKGELVRKIARTEGEEAAKEAADAMEKEGLLDDTAFADRYADELFGKRLFGKRRVVYELVHRGINKSLAEEVCAEKDIAPKERALAFLEKKYQHAAEDEKARRRAFAGLERAGYDWSTAHAAMEDFMA